MNLCLKFRPSKQEPITNLLGLLIKRTKFSDSFFRLDEFESKKSLLVAKDFNQVQKITTLKDKVRFSLLKNQKLDRKDVENLFYVSKSEEDLELSLDAFKSFVNFF